MKPHASFPAALFLLWILAIPSPAEESPPPQQWTNRKGITIPGRFVKMSGDQIIIEQDGRELSFSVTQVSEASARQARQLAGIDEPPATAPVAGPLRMKFQPVVMSRLETDDTMRPRFGIQQKKLSSAKFKMGSPPEEPGREESETVHTVWFKRDFQLKDTEVTWGEWKAVRDRAANYDYTDISPGCNGQGGGGNDRHPVLGITWWDAVKWCNLVSQINDKTPVYYTHPSCKIEFLLKTGTPPVFADWNADGYRLPTEAEWESACCPGTSKNAFHTGPIRQIGVTPVDRNLDKAGWFAGNSGGGTHPVASKEPNSLGLYDMHGNAAEWCWDLAGKLATTEAYDPRGAEYGEARIIRGGSWHDPARYCRASYRGSRNPTAMPNPSVGFRPAMTLPLAGK